jgi:hypothetical protein
MEDELIMHTYWDGETVRQEPVAPAAFYKREYWHKSGRLSLTLVQIEEAVAQVCRPKTQKPAAQP